MVVLIVKGTKTLDEFRYNTGLGAKCGPLAKTLCRIQTKRFRVKLQLFSMHGLMESEVFKKKLKASQNEQKEEKLKQGASDHSNNNSRNNLSRVEELVDDDEGKTGGDENKKKAAAPQQHAADGDGKYCESDTAAANQNNADMSTTTTTTTATATSIKSHDGNSNRAVIAFAEKYEAINALIRDTRAVITHDEQYEEIWEDIRELTAEVFPEECRHKDGFDAAVGRLYELHDNPELDEEYRLQVYHCRQICDPDTRTNEVWEEDTVALWFAGKPMLGDEATLGDFCGKNEKTCVTVKLAKADGPAPALEPRIAFDMQREMRKAMEQRRAVLATLEEPELRDAAMRKVKMDAKMKAVPAGCSGRKSSDPVPLPDAAALQPIRTNAVETVIEGM